MVVERNVEVSMKTRMKMKENTFEEVHLLLFSYSTR